MRPLLIVTLLMVSRLPAADVPGTTLSDETVDVTVVVALTGDDATGAGTAASPYRTIAKGLAVARTLGVPRIFVGGTEVPNPDAKRVKVLIKAGTYREGDIESNTNQDSVKTLVITGEADSSGRPTTLFSGLEVLGGAWTDNGDGTWTHPWTLHYGTVGWPSTFNPLPTDNQIAARREIVMIGNRLLEQRTAVAGLGPECFTVDEGAHTIVLRTATDPNAAVIEFGAHQKLLGLRRHSNLVIRNISFEGAAGYLWDGNYGSAVDITNGDSSHPWVENVLIENCHFDWNGGSGLTTNAVQRMTVRACSMADNGGTGVSFGGSSYVRFENSTIARNWWRGLWGRQSGDIDAGSKNGGLYHALFKNLTVEGNLARGLWFDVYCKDVTVEGCSIAANWGGGAYFEINLPGDVVRDCVIRDNGSWGIHLNTTRQVTITGNAIANNIDGAINLSVGSRTGSTTDRDTGLSATVASTQDVTITGNTLVAQSYLQSLIAHEDDASHAPPLIATLVCSGNTYHQDSPLFRKGFAGADFATWKNQVGRGGVTLEAGSTCSEPDRVPVASDGLLDIEWYEGAGGRDPATAAALNLAKDARYVRKAPLFRALPPVCEGQPNVVGSSARVARGWIVPPASGSYRFWIAGGEQVRLRLSTTDQEADATLVASTAGRGSLAREWDKDAGQAVAPRTLSAGRRYWFELVQTTDSTDGTTGSASPKNQQFALAWVPPADGVHHHGREVLPRQVIVARPDGALGTGTARREGWVLSFGTEIWQLTGDSSHIRPEFPNHWAVRQELESLDIGRNWSKEAGNRVRANVVPTSSGTYTFWVASRGRSELWLSPTADPAGRVKIAEVMGSGTAYRAWTTQTTQRSGPIVLVAGIAYALELLQKSDANDAEDHASVAWSTNADDPAPAIIGSANLQTVSAPDPLPPIAASGTGAGGAKHPCGSGSLLGAAMILAALLTPGGIIRRRRLALAKDPRCAPGRAAALGAPSCRTRT